MHYIRKGIVGGRLLDPDCMLGDDFVGLHIGLGARPGLPENEWKVILSISLKEATSAAAW